MAKLSRPIVYFAPLVLFAALAGLLYVGLDLNPREVPSPLIDKTAPEFDLPLLTTGGATDERVSVNDLQGQAWVLNVFASWCVSCRAEHAVIEKLAANTESKVVGLNYKDAEADAVRWLGMFGNPYDAIVIDEAGQTGIDWGVYGVPETFIIDREGVIRHKHIGPLDERILIEEFLPVLRRVEGA